MRNNWKWLGFLTLTISVAGCDYAAGPVDAEPPRDVSHLVMAVMSGMDGSGAIGSGTPTFTGVDRQYFWLGAGVSATGTYGRFEYIDSGFVKEDGNPPHFVVGPEWEGTMITGFAPTSETCVGVDGVGRLLNTNELLAFRVEACDNGQPGVDSDVFSIRVPWRLVTHGEVYGAGPATLWQGELTGYHAGVSALLR